MNSGASDGSDLQDIVVTARRVSENVQRIPVTVQAFDGNALRSKSVETPQDLQQLTPGVFLAGSGPAENTVYVIRGQAKPLVGVGQAAVLSYLSDVPLPTIASTQPVYDMASVQILKGPQGTLFGRNTTGGAVLFYPQAPTFDTNGYVQIQAGNYDLFETEGAINTPLVDDKIALRVAGRFGRRDGFVKNLGIGRDFENMHNWSGRASLLIQPSENVKNLTTIDYYHANEGGSAQIFAGFFPGSSLGELAGSTNPKLTDILANQRRIGIRRTISDVPNYSYVTAKGVINRTDVDLGAISVTNIFGYRSVSWRAQFNYDGLPAVDLFGSGVPGPVLNTYRSNAFGQFTDELQLKGKAFDDRLTWLVGAFYLKSKPNGQNTDRADVFGANGTAIDTFVTEESKALFANVSYQIASSVTLNGGFRYTWDKIDVCSAAAPNFEPPYAGRVGRCNDGSLINAARTKASFHKPTWTVGVDWQVDPNTFLYVTSRRGYRAGGVNVPALGPALSSYQKFDPETITDVEIGAKTNWRLGDVHGRFNVAGFYAKTKDVQYNIIGLFTDPSTCSPATNFDGDCDMANDPSSSALTVNAGDTSVRGIEAQLTVIPVRHLTLDAGMSYIKPKTDKADYGALAPIVTAGGEDPDKIPFRFVPKTTISLKGSYEVPLADGSALVANVDYYWSDKVQYGIYTAPSYAMVNGRLDWNDIFGSTFDIGVFVRNAFNKKSVASGGTIGLAPGTISLIYNDPRTVGASLRARF